MPNKGKEPDRGYPFKPGAKNPPLAPSEEVEEEEEEFWVYPDEGDIPFASASGSHPHYPAQSGYCTDLTPEEREWYRQTSDMGGAEPVDNASDPWASFGDFDEEFRDFMNLNINPNGESSSPSAPSDMPDNEEAVAVPESSSRAAKQKCPRRKASPVQCDWEGCGKLFPRPTELHKHVNKVHKPHIPCAARLAPTVHGLPPCDKAYSTKNDMYRHVRSTHPDFAAVKENGIPEEGGLCPICHQRIRDRNSNIKRHIDEVHKNQKRSRRDS